MRWGITKKKLSKQWPALCEDKSKSELKREMTALQALGKRLVELPKEQAKGIEIPAELQEAVLLARTLKNHSALRRQIQYIGALMRRIDTESVRQAIDDIDRGQKRKAREFHRLEQMRDSLVEGDDTVLNEISSSFPDADIRRLRQFVRGARKENKENQTPVQSRALFKYLRELSSES